MPGIVSLLVALVLIVVIAAVVLVVVAAPHAGARRLSAPMERLERALPEETSPAYGVLSSPDGSRRVEQRFERAETVLQRGAQALTGRSPASSAGADPRADVFAADAGAAPAHRQAVHPRHGT